MKIINPPLPPLVKGARGIWNCLREAKDFNLKSKICNLKWNKDVLFGVGEKVAAAAL